VHGTSERITLNPAQNDAAGFAIPGSDGGALVPGPPLLIIAGAGAGKTRTLAHRVARLVARGADPARILLLTFSRRAAEAMTRQAEAICGELLAGRSTWNGRLPWSGTFHSIGARLLREYADATGLDPAFTVLDRGDAADLLDLVRDDLGLSEKDRRFPKKGTCLAIYSYATNAQAPLADVLARAFPWCAGWTDELRQLFGAYVEAKQRQSVLDYDDLLLCWERMMAVPDLAADVGARFDFVLVDEYQDTNTLQARILMALRPDGRGLTVVGDDAQAIYAFRAATVRNILDFPTQFAPPARVIALEQNYRSTGPILAAANAVIRLAPERFTKDLFSTRASRQKPFLRLVRDETAQVDHVVRRILENLESGVHLREQAVLFRTGHHSAALEVELGRRNIPFVKFGGLRFLEAAHVKDLLAFLRWAENPKDEVAAFRVLKLLPGVGPGTARRAIAHVQARGSDLAALSRFVPPAAAADLWPGLAALIAGLRQSRAFAAEVAQVRRFYDPLVPALYDHPGPRLRDLDQLEQIAASFPSRERFLSDLALDPPQAVGDDAVPPRLDDDYLILSTIHSAKGQEWTAVYVLNVVDGCIPSDMAAGSAEEIEEERRLLYVAMTRAKDELHLLHPHRFYVTGQARFGDRYVQAPRSRFIPDALLPLFDRDTLRHESDAPVALPRPRVMDLGASLRSVWR
jgi:DNA helicase-2/ATP-dependent DNA helicase PcrA